MNGQAKLDFEKWLDKEYDIHPCNQECAITTCLNALIIEWFSTLKYEGKNFWLYVFEFYYELRIDSMTISDINEQAINKAVEIYNNSK